METTAVPSNVHPQKVMKTGDIDEDEKTFVVSWGKGQKQLGKDVQKMDMQRAYCKHFPGYNRHADVLIGCWVKWYRNQRGSNSVWYKSLTK